MKCSNLSAGVSSSWKEYAGADPALDGCSSTVFSEWALSKRSRSADEADESSAIPSTGPGAHWGWTGAQERLLTDWASPSCYCFLSWHCRAEMNCCVLQGKLIQWDSSIPFMGEVLHWDLWLCSNTESCLPHADEFYPFQPEAWLLRDLGYPLQDFYGSLR